MLEVTEIPSLTTASNKPMGIRDLEEWALSHGATLHENVEVYEDNSGFSLKTRVDADGIRICVTEGAAKKPIVSCPLQLSLSAFNAFHECPLSRLTGPDDPTRFPEVFLAKTPFHVIGKFFLCQQYLISKDSFWFPYISALPQPGRDECGGGNFNSNDAERLGTPLFWGEDDLDWIRGTNMDAARIERLELWQQEWSDGCSILRDEGFAEWKSYTYNLYGWASTIFSSRCFVSSLLPDYALKNESSVQWMERVGKEHNSSQILFPLVDLANHDPKAKLTWKVDKFSNSNADLVNTHGADACLKPVKSLTSESVDAFQIIAESDVPPGQEVFNNYGSMKYNSELLLGYGFCLPDIKNDYIAVEFTNADWLEAAHKIWETKDCYTNVNDNSSPLNTEIKRRFVLSWNTRVLTEEGRTGIAKEFQMFEHGLFDLLAIELANKSEKTFIAETPSLCLETASPDGPLARLLLATTSAVLEKLEHDRRKILKYNGNLRNPKTTAQRHAKIYREGQLLLLNDKITSLEQYLKNTYKYTEYLTINENPESVPAATLWTLHRAYDLLENWQGSEKTGIQEVCENARRILELEPDESFYGPEVIEAGWDSTLWMLWLYIASNLISLSCQHTHSLPNNQMIHIYAWIRRMEKKYPVHTDPPRPFSGDDQERQTLMDILRETAMGRDDVFAIGERISWASFVVGEEGVRVEKVWVGGGEDELEELEIRQLVMCVGR